MSSLTIVMYHYVRQLERTRFPAIRGLRTTEFREQVVELMRRGRAVSMQEVMHCIRTGDKLPPNAFLLTFDDGYIDHYTNVFPILHEFGIAGAFFAPVVSVGGGELLDVNRVHFLLASVGPTQLASEIDAWINANAASEGLVSVEHYRSRWRRANRWDDAETIYVKRMLQVGLPYSVRTRVARDLFAKFVSSDDVAFASELYLGPEHLRLMHTEGMYIGSHTYSHPWLDSLSPEQQEEEVDRSLQFLAQLGIDVSDFWVMCYPYGAWNDSLLSILRSRSCALGLTTEARTARLDTDLPLVMPRLDTNDIRGEVFST